MGILIRNQDGEAWVKREDKTIKLANYLLFVGGMLPGEPVYSLVVLSDKITYLAACLIPEPLEIYGEDGRHVTMELITYRKAFYLIQGEKFQPNEIVTLSIHSSEGLVVKKLRTTQTGSFVYLLEGNPPRDKRLETERIHISTTEQLNPMILSYDWKFLNANGGNRGAPKKKSLTKK